MQWPPPPGFMGRPPFMPPPGFPMPYPPPGAHHGVVCMLLQAAGNSCVAAWFVASLRGLRTFASFVGAFGNLISAWCLVICEERCC